ncbi:MAG: ADP-ribosylglycohydrolase family protein [Candidatus Buchananbacteria bacterium]
MDKAKIEPTKLEKIIGSFLSVLIGDAMGMPWEIMTHKEIMFATRGRGVSGFSRPRQTKIHDTMYLEAVQFTDDYQLTRAVVISLIRSGGFNLIDCIKAHLDELEKSDCGFGSSTKKNLLVLKELFAHLEPGMLPVLPKGEDLLGKGAGNGIAMKVAPLAIYYHDDQDELFEVIRKLGSVTHRDPQAYLSAYLVARFISTVYNESIGFGTKEELKNQIQEITSDLFCETIVRGADLFNGNMSQLQYNMMQLGNLVQSGRINDPRTVAETLGTGCYCANSIPFSIAMALRHMTDLRAAIIETINQGGDTDSNASMVGAIVGANLGVMAIPEEWRNFRPEYVEPGQWAAALFSIMDK